MFSVNSIIKLILGAEISQKNFNSWGLIASGIVIFFGYWIFVVGDFFGIIDNLLTISEQPWYSFILAKFSFLIIFVKIIVLSLFTRKQNTIGRFIAAFAIQLMGFLGTVILHSLTNSFENLITDPEMKAWLPVLPYLISVPVFLMIRGVYEKRTFSVERYFGTR